jgi:hypothetical protein
MPAGGTATAGGARLRWSWEVRSRGYSDISLLVRNHYTLSFFGGKVVEGMESEYPE